MMGADKKSAIQPIRNRPTRATSTPVVTASSDTSAT